MTGFDEDMTGWCVTCCDGRAVVVTIRAIQSRVEYGTLLSSLIYRPSRSLSSRSHLFLVQEPFVLVKQSFRFGRKTHVSIFCSCSLSSVSSYSQHLLPDKTRSVHFPTHDTAAHVKNTGQRGIKKMIPFNCFFRPLPSHTSLYIIYKRGTTLSSRPVQQLHSFPIGG